MRFTDKNSLRNIVSDGDMRTWLKMFYWDPNLDLFTEDLWDMPLREVAETAVTPWNDPFTDLVDQLLLSAELIEDLKAQRNYKVVPLWAPETEWQIGSGESGGAKEDVFLLAPRVAPSAKRPAVIICPGGGYTGVCMAGEGTPILKKMEEAGYGAFILHYRVAPAVYPQPQEDLVLAIKYVQANAQAYGVDPDDILLIGFSAAGHLCALTAACYGELEKCLQAELEQTRPDLAEKYRAFTRGVQKVGLAYPVISLDTDTHEGSAESLTGKREELRKALSVENLVTEEYPKTFLWACADDDVVPPSNALRMMAALSAKGLRYEGHIYPSGGHGCSLAVGKSAEGWLDRLIRYMR